MRGEDVRGVFRTRSFCGSPPHARGRQLRPGCHRRPSRITPACAGKTQVWRVWWTPHGDHPRMRGEDTYITNTRFPENGSPPHARGRRHIACTLTYDDRITPACAGKTEPTTLYMTNVEDHPRMRGEDVFAPFVPPFERGSPPHARGRQVGLRGSPLGEWITPACAGKTKLIDRLWRPTRDHPRMRGEDFSETCGKNLSWGSPPHARGRLERFSQVEVREGITPACAGKTNWLKRHPEARKDHPRMRGEDS